MVPVGTLVDPVDVMVVVIMDDDGCNKLFVVLLFCTLSRPPLSIDDTCADGRDGAIQRLGVDDDDVAPIRPGIVVISLVRKLLVVVVVVVDGGVDVGCESSSLLRLTVCLLLVSLPVAACSMVYRPNGTYFLVARHE